MTEPGNCDPSLADTTYRLASHLWNLLHTLALERPAPPIITPFLDDWPTEWRRREPAGTWLPVLSRMQEFAADETAFGRSMITVLCRAAPGLTWRQTYAACDVGEEFLRNYAWTEILGSAGPLVSEHLTGGFLVLGSDTRYPPHRHAAEEIYVPLSGTALWQQGDASWRERQPGSVIRHASDEPHAMQTGTQPLLALYLWRGDTAGKSTMLN